MENNSVLFLLADSIFALNMKPLQLEYLSCLMVGCFQEKKKKKKRGVAFEQRKIGSAKEER